MLTEKEKKQIKDDFARVASRLGNNDDFKAYNKYLRLYLAETRERGDIMTGDEKGWNQGWCQALSFVTELVNSSMLSSQRAAMHKKSC